MAYAERTDVPVTRSQGQITDLLRKYDATQIAMGWSPDGGQVGFQVSGRVYRIIVPISSQVKNPGQVERSKWRAILLIVKAKLESVDAGITTMEAAFLADTVMPSGRTVFEETAVAIERSYIEGRNHPLLALEG